MMNKPLLSYLTAAAVLAGCAGSYRTATNATATTAASKAAGPILPGVGLDVADLDTTVSPCDDFFHYSGGNWLRNNPIPAYASSWGPRNLLGDRTQALLKQILEDAANTRASKGSNLQKVGDYYASGMDSVGLDRAGLKYLQPELRRIDAIISRDALRRELAHQQTLGTGAYFRAGVSPDRKNSSVYAVNLNQGGLSMPDRDYYLKDDVRSTTVRNAYVEYMTTVFELLGNAPATAQQRAANVLALETRLARASKSRVELRDPYANYNKMPLAEFDRAYPAVGLGDMLKQNGLGAVQEVIVGQPAFFQELNTVLQSTPLLEQKTYLTWQLVSSITSALPQAYSDAAFRFQQVQSGTKQQPTRWKRMLAATDGTLGEAFGQLYVDKAFSPEAKQKALDMLANIKESMAEHIRSNTWMSSATKTEALKKLNALRVKIGYPDKWKDYSTLNISRESYLQNVLAARQWNYARNVEKYGQPIDRTEWGMTPPTINAYYSPAMNEIVFPAGYLQPPFFDPKADDAVNYGAIGGVMGHEMTHAFDDQGRQYDSEGNLRDWWTKADGEEFTKRAAVVGTQYSAFSPLDSVYVNGKLTMGENLADFSGLTIVYDALQKQLQQKYGSKPRPRYDGFTPEQRFFLSWAQLRRTNIRPEALRQQILTDPHSPGQYRTIGPLMNMPQFYEAFGCQPGQKMVRNTEDRAKIW
ncbi:M13 family metallopeptidase [Hymenobacter profundi]|uniref:M13 family metallopeptidase n=1 Tax=Hymenobacter profundi TaxID=1982110 RepID=A0ABS6WWN4_9BACT|nr:M13 family metallopeptidase [Hymenobacter profundi]MBW3128007.1 M13 family metallopeptidase [Hymenobacter profundi]